MLALTNYNEIIEISIYILLYSLGDTMKKILRRRSYSKLDTHGFGEMLITRIKLL